MTQEANTSTTTTDTGNDEHSSDAGAPPESPESANTDNAAGETNNDDADEEVKNPAAVLAALREERETRKKLEKQLNGTRTQSQNRVAELEAQVAQLTAERQQVQAQAAAAQAGATSPELVAKLTADAENPVAAVEELKKQHPELFGTAAPKNVHAGQGRDGQAGRTSFGEQLAQQLRR